MVGEKKITALFKFCDKNKLFKKQEVILGLISLLLDR